MKDLFLFSADFGDTLVRFFVCLIVNWMIVHFLYFKKGKRRDFYFTFMIISVAIFFLVYLMMGMDRGKATMGVGLGLFGIFSIMRYRTDTMPVREMTYLFVITAVSLVNAVSVGAPFFEVVITNAIIILAVWLCEQRLKTRPTRVVQYDRIELITPERRQELIADLEKRLGVKVVKVDIGSIDFLRDMAMIRVSYEGDDTTSIGSELKLSKDQLKEF